MAKRFDPYLVIAHAAEHRHGVDYRLIIAVMDRESTCGLTLRPIGPRGTGDWSPRKWMRYRGSILGPQLKHWVDEVGDEVCMPLDGHGWGRGLMQIDYADPDNAEFLAWLLPHGTPAWQDATENIDFGTRKLAKLIQVFNGNEGLAASAYNAGVPAVSRATMGLTLPAKPETLQRAADSVTTNKDYGSDVLARRTLFFPPLAPHTEGTPHE